MKKTKTNKLLGIGLGLLSILAVGFQYEISSGAEVKDNIEGIGTDITVHGTGTITDAEMLKEVSGPSQPTSQKTRQSNYHAPAKPTLTIKAHLGNHSKTIGKGLNKRWTKIFLHTHGFHIHGKAQLATHKVHGKTVTYIRGISADPHYKITSIKLVNSHKNTTAHVYVKKS